MYPHKNKKLLWVINGGVYITCLLEVKGVDPSPGLEISSYILLTGGAPLLSLWAGTTGCGGDPPTMHKKQVRKQVFHLSDKIFLSFTHFKKKSIYSFWESKRECTSRGGAERDRIPSRLCAVSTGPNAGLDPMNRKIRAWATQVPLSHLYL